MSTPKPHRSSSRPRVRRPAAVPRAAKRASAPRTIRVLIADSQPIDRRGLALLLAAEPGLTIVGEAATASEAVRACGCLQPDVLVLDTKMAGLDGVTAIPAVRAASPGTRIVAIAGRGEAGCGGEANAAGGARCEHARDCLTLGIAHGAHGALHRSAEPGDLVHAVRAVASGHTWYEPGLASGARPHARLARGRAS